MDPDTAPLDWSPETEEDYEVARSFLKERFASWCLANGTVFEADPGEALIHYKWHYLDRHLTAWTMHDLDEIYLELHPAKMVVEEDELASVLVEARTFLSFLAEEGLLDSASDPLNMLIEHLERIEKRFVRNMSDVSRYSQGKRFVMAAITEGVALDDHDALQSFMASFNARKRQRDATLGQRALGGSLASTSGRVTAPGTRPRPKSSSAKRRRRGH